MYDLISIGDVKLDAFIDLNACKEKCSLAKKNVCFNFGEKISIELLDQQVAGSAPNVATAIARLGHKTAVISNMGKDATHDMTLKALADEGVDTKFIKAHKGVASAYSAVLSLQGEKTILVSYIEKPYKLPTPLPKTRWMYMSEMGAGYEKLFTQVSRAVQKRGIKLGFNPGNKQIAERKEALYKLIKHTKVLFVNVEEGQRIARTKTSDIKTLGKKLLKLGPKEVVVTDGPKGSYGFSADTAVYCPIYPGDRIESTGAGDSFASAYIGARMNDLSIEEALKWGSTNAASVVLAIGPVPGLLNERQIKSRLKKLKSYRVTPL